jgi:hypothetical protein
VPAGGIANPHPGGPGSPVGRQKDRSARSALNRRLEASGQNTCELESSGNPVLGLSHRGRSRWRVPRRSADRRARPLPNPPRQAGEGGDKSAPPRKRRLVGQCAFRRFASLFVCRASLFLERGESQSSGAEASRERFSASSLRAKRSNPGRLAQEAGLLRGACHRAGHFGPDPLARNDEDASARTLPSPLWGGVGGWGSGGVARASTNAIHLAPPTHAACARCASYGLGPPHKGKGKAG